MSHNDPRFRFSGRDLVNEYALRTLLQLQLKLLVTIAVQSEELDYKYTRVLVHRLEAR
jgi:hypothetical protein